MQKTLLARCGYNMVKHYLEKNYNMRYWHFMLSLAVKKGQVVLGTWEKNMFLFFEICIFTLFIGIFIFFPYITLVFFGVKLLVTDFHLGMWYLGWKILVPIEIEDFFNFLKIPFFTVKWVIFSIFWQFFNITLVILEISMACDISFYAIFSQQLWWK